MGARLLPTRAVTATTLLIVATTGFASAGCAEVYAPRGPGVAVVSEPWGGPKVYRDGRQVDSIEEAVRGNPRAEEQASTASSHSTAATVFGVLGAVSVGVGTALVVVDAGNTSNTANAFPTSTGWAGVGLLIGSIGLNIASGAFRSSAQTHYFNAANIYNDEMGRAVVPAYPPAYGVPAPGFRPLPGFNQPPQYAPPRAPPPGMTPSPPNWAPPPPGLTPSPPPGAPPIQPLPPGALPPAGVQPVPLQQ